MDDALARIRAILDAEGVKVRVYTVSEAIERLRQEEVPRFRHPRKALSHIAVIERYAGAKSLGAIAEVAAQYRLDHPHLAVATCNRRLAVLRRVARLAYRRWSWLSRPVYIELQPEHNRRHRYLGLAEVERLLEACNHEPTRDAVILAVLHRHASGGDLRARPNERSGGLPVAAGFQERRAPAHPDPRADD